MSNVISSGKQLKEAEKVAIMIHGRGANAGSILSLHENLALDDFALLAPQAPGNTWYPFSFMAPDQNNEPSFSQSLDIIDSIVKELKDQGFTADQIYLIGFSQGACLTLEYAAQHAEKYGAVIAFTGGLIGEKIRSEKYTGDFGGTKIFIGSGFKDPHVPLHRIEDSKALLEKQGAEVKILIFEDFNHTIRQEEIDWVNENLLV